MWMWMMIESGHKLYLQHSNSNSCLQILYLSYSNLLVTDNKIVTIIDSQ